MYRPAAEVATIPHWIDPSPIVRLQKKRTCMQNTQWCIWHGPTRGAPRTTPATRPRPGSTYMSSMHWMWSHERPPNHCCVHPCCSKSRPKKRKAGTHATQQVSKCVVVWVGSWSWHAEHNNSNNNILGRTSLTSMYFNNVSKIAIPNNKENQVCTCTTSDRCLMHKYNQTRPAVQYMINMVW